jgi:serine/threonine-protein kinase
MAEEHAGPLGSRLQEALRDSYLIEGEIGRGGMGVVYSARDLKLKRRVAIKVLPPELAFRPEIRTRFLREAETAARLSHPHIVAIHAVGEADDLVYFVMAYVDGESLAARLRRRKRLPPEEVRRIMKETADALGIAHAMGVIHRDIKPDNILLEGTRRRVVVTDFGIAKALSEGGAGTLTGTGVVIGTPTYMSPEQAAGEREIDARSDIYSLGLVGYEMLAGEPPFQAATVPGILMKQISEPAPEIKTARPDCPDDLAYAIMRCLEKKREDRWPTADALRRALESRSAVAARRGAPVAAQRPGAPPPRPPQPRAQLPQAEPAGGPEAEPAAVRKFRAHLATYLCVNGGLLLINLATGIADPWFLWPAILWGAFGLAPQYSKLWQQGYSWRDVLHPPPARDAVPPAVPQPRLPQPRGKIAGRHPMSAEAVSEELGRWASQVRQMQADRAAISRLLERLPPSERRLLPDVQGTVDALLTRATELAQTLHQLDTWVDAGGIARLDQRIRELENNASGAGQDRRLELLWRQRSALSELVERRKQIEAQFESCVLAMQNVRFDLLRLRSAGVAAALEDLTSATQQAKALSADVEAAIGAAADVKELLRR